MNLNVNVMKKYTIIVLSIALFVFGCKGPEGPQGPMGQQGAQGSEGSKGAKGEDGSLGIKETGWIKLDYSDSDYRNYYRYDNVFGDAYSTSILFELRNREQPLLTKSILESGFFYIYVKQKKVDLITFELVDVLYSGGTVNTECFFERELDERAYNFYDFVSFDLVIEEFKENYWNPYIYFLTPAINANVNGQNVLVSRAPELNLKSSGFYRELLGRYVPEIRMITIEGTQVGRLKNINWENYEETMELLGLEL